MIEAAAVRADLRERGAETIEHPGGTLYTHLVRVFERLAVHRLRPEVQCAGLVHAFYGTDGFDVFLQDRADRDPLRRLVGPETELLVYRYAGCDRSRSWPGLAETRQVWSRFDGTVETLNDGELRDFVDLCVVNELDVVEQSPAIAEKYGGYFRKLFVGWRSVASPPVMADADAVLTGRV
jgi:hypothetical protein